MHFYFYFLCVIFAKIYGMNVVLIKCVLLIIAMIAQSRQDLAHRVLWSQENFKLKFNLRNNLMADNYDRLRSKRLLSIKIY